MKLVSQVVSLAIVSMLAACGGGGGSGNSCQNKCAKVDSTRCSGALVQTCQADAQGCLGWSEAAACPAAGECSDATGACVPDPCGGVPISGACADAGTVTYCGLTTDATQALVQSYTCPIGESCQIKNGGARCVLTGACVTGDTECLDGGTTTLRTCNAGQWESTDCTTSCKATALGAFCAPTGSFTTRTGRVLFEEHMPNTQRSDWQAAATLREAKGFLVVSRGAGGVYDAVYTSDAAGTAGEFAIQVPTAAAAGDNIVVTTAADDGAGRLSFAVIDPGFLATGTKSPGQVGTPRLWSWSWLTSAVTEGQDYVISEARGSGAANVFQGLRESHAATQARYAQGGATLAAWFGIGTEWSCGACFGQLATTAFGMYFQSQLWIGGGAENQAYWSDAVNDHELGHWAMASFGVSPDEGGQHFLGRPTFPGQAWAEGWATWFSSAVRADPLYYDKQDGTFFWLDLGAAQYYTGTPFVQPTAGEGLLQKLDENEVSAMMWSLSRSSAGAETAVFQALASPRMTTFTATRGYTQHTWDFDTSGNFTSVVDTHEPAMCFADFLDALDCAGFSRTALDAATIPATQYPYPSASPICN